MFSSCSDDVNEGLESSPVQTISLAVANAGDNFAGTRAADRPLYSSEANQSIENVKVVIYKLDGVNEIADATSQNMYGEKTIVAQKLFTPWMNGGISSSYANAANGHGRQASWTLADGDLIKEEGVYMAYAVGYNTDNYGALTAFHALDKAGTATFPLNVATTTNGVKEIFAGSALFKVTKKTVAGADNTESYHFNVKLTLHRQVAGTIGYFTNIPTKGNADFATEDGAKLRLVASAKNTNAVFAGFNSDFIGGVDANGNGTPGTDANVKYVVNGYTSATADAKFYGSTANDAFTVYEITLNEWFNGTDKMDTNDDGLLNGNDTWQNHIYAANDGNGALKLQAGSVLGSSFLMPFALVENKATFQLQMLNAGGDVIRYWNIRLPKTQTATDSQIGKQVSIVSNAGAVTASTATESNINYSIVRNHLYTIGERDLGNNPDITDPVDPDKPQNLNDETLILKVNDNWEMIHHLEVD